MILLSECTNNNIWNSFLKKEKSNQLITIAHNPSIGPILEKTFGYESQNMVITEGDKMVGVLPVVKVGKKLVSMPHFSYGGPIMDSNKEVEFDIETVFDNKKFEARSFKKLTDYLCDKKVSTIVELKASAEDQLNELTAKFRRKIRNAEKLNYNLVQGGAELVDDFYLLYAKKMLQKGSPPLGKNFFQNLLSDYEFGKAEIVAIYDNEQVVAAGFTLSYLGFNELCWASSCPQYDKYNVNSLLYWNIIKDSIAANQTYFSMGRSTVNSTNHFYKRQWKPIDFQVYYNYSEPIGKSIKEFTFLTKIWKLQPLMTSVYFGQIISKYIY